MQFGLAFRGIKPVPAERERASVTVKEKTLENYPVILFPRDLVSQVHVSLPS